ncbi:MAG: DUF2975 domain-containing protein [Sphingobacteriaceae bacterium]|nr:DUF2975 domain-containing protein [Sphingobacteriaceae bacterium]
MKTKNQVTLIKSFYLILIFSIITYAFFISARNTSKKDRNEATKIEHYKVAVYEKEVQLVQKGQKNIQWVNKKNSDTLNLKNVTFVADAQLLNKKYKTVQTNFYKVVVDIALLPLFILMIYFFATLYNFIDSISKEKIFEFENYRRLKLMSYSIIALSIFDSIFQYGNFYSNRKIFANTPYEVVNTVEFDLISLFFGITLLTISFVFKKGIDLKKEQDLTI